MLKLFVPSLTLPDQTLAPVASRRKLRVARLAVVVPERQHAAQVQTGRQGHAAAQVQRVLGAVVDGAAAGAEHGALEALGVEVVDDALHRGGGAAHGRELAGRVGAHRGPLHGLAAAGLAVGVELVPKPAVEPVAVAERELVGVEVIALTVLAEALARAEQASRQRQALGSRLGDDDGAAHRVARQQGREGPLQQVDPRQALGRQHVPARRVEATEKLLIR
jgi:hypothetical protein